MGRSCVFGCGQYRQGCRVRLPRPHKPHGSLDAADAFYALQRLRLTRDGFGARLHHRDVVGVALRRLKSEFDSGKRDEILADFEKEVRKN